MNRSMRLHCKTLFLGIVLFLPCVSHAGDTYIDESVWLSQLQQGVYTREWINIGAYDEEDNIEISGQTLKKVVQFLTGNRMGSINPNAKMAFSTSVGDEQVQLRWKYRF